MPDAWGSEDIAMIVVFFPTYDGTRYNAATTTQVAEWAARHGDTALYEFRSSLLARGFNEGWMYAREHGATRFFMIHSDIVPTTEGWIDKMLDLMDKKKATVLSVVSPIKNSSGLTSTAIESDDEWNPYNLSMKDVEMRPPTWTEDGLLVNTGLMLVDMTPEWMDDICFTIRDRIRNRKVECISEDWDFSRQIRAHDGSVFATREISVQHFGTHSWGSGTHYVEEA
jgi:GT2 family glycosyltransferase